MPTLLGGDEGEPITYSEFMTMVEQGVVRTADIENGTGRITGELTNGDQYVTTGGGDGPNEVDRALLDGSGVDVGPRPGS